MERLFKAYDILENRIDMVRKIRRYKDSGAVSDSKLQEMVDEIRQFEDNNNLSACEIFNHQSY